MSRFRRSTLMLLTAVAAVPLSSGIARADVPVFSAEGSCTDAENDPRQVVVIFGGADGTEYDLYIEDVDKGSYVSGQGAGTSVPFDGAYHVVVTLKDTEQVVFEKTVIVACENPVILVQGACKDDGGHLGVFIAPAEEGPDYTFSVEVDDQAVDGFESLTDTGGVYVDLGVFANGEHHVEVLWWLGDSSVDDTSNNVTLDCEVDGGGSGAGIPDAGASTAPLLVIAGALLALGAALLVGRRVRTA